MRRGRIAFRLLAALALVLSSGLMAVQSSAATAADLPKPSTATPQTTEVKPVSDGQSHLSGFPLAFPDAWMEVARFSSLPGWAEDAQERAWKPFLTSCDKLSAQASAPRTAPRIWAALKIICAEAATLGKDLDRASTRAFFERHFRPVRIARHDQTQGFVTGYYEPEVMASRERTDVFATPFLARPADLTQANPPASGGFDARGGAGRWVNGKFEPYFDREAIEKGALDGQGLELAWVRDPTDVLFTQIQGSARLRFADGGTLRIGYAAHNGHRYVPVGRVLVERGVATREQMSMDFIRAWMSANESAARELRWVNKSYVFFEARPALSAEDGPIGGQGVPITDWRSIAIDRNVHTYGTPMYIDGQLPTGALGTNEPWQRLMIAQDTGSAILGPARGDLYLGTGFEAGSISGRFRDRVDWYVLLPASLSPDAAEVPVPIARPDHPRGRR